MHSPKQFEAKRPAGWKPVWRVNVRRVNLDGKVIEYVERIKTLTELEFAIFMEGVTDLQVREQSMKGGVTADVGAEPLGEMFAGLFS